MEIGSSNELNSQFGVQRFQTEQAKDKELGQQDFLRLIVAQIQNQDPFEPVENGAFIGQLAQFGTVDGVNNLNESFAEFANGISSSQALNAAGLIGKSVDVEGNQVSLEEGQDVTAYVNAGGQIGTAKVTIRNATGEVIQTREVQLTNPELNSFSWDGLNAQGEAVEPGAYFISASVLSGENDLTLSTTVQSKVASVNLANANSIELGLESGDTILFNEVQKISQ